MNLIRLTMIVPLCLVGTALSGIPDSRAADKIQDQAARTKPTRQDQELLDLIHVAQQLAQQNQEELKHAREENQNLERLLEQALQELTQLRQEVSLMRSQMLSSQSRVTPAAPLEGMRPGSGEVPVQNKVPASSEDNLAARLSQVEDQVELNTAQIKEHAQTKVESDSRFKVRLFGTVLNNTYFNTNDSAEEAVPTAAPPPSASGTGHNLGATLRQTQFGFAMTGPKVGAAQLSADVDFDFFGGVDGAYEGDVLGALRMRTATARLDGPLTSFAIGLMSPMFSPLNPTSLAAVYYPALGESGNLWQWRPQMVIERRIPVSETEGFVLQGGLMMPFGETVDGTRLQGRPGYESRIAFARTLDTDRRLEIGFGGYFYPQLLGFQRSVDSYAVSSDWMIPLTRRLVLSGEAYFGQSISLDEQSGGNIAEAFAFSGPLDNPTTTVRGIHSIGGWAQLSAKATPKLEFNMAYGADDPRNRDIFAGLFDPTTRLNNQTVSVNSIYRLRSDFLISVEYRRLWTTYPEARTTNGHVNLAIGYVF